MSPSVMVGHRRDARDARCHREDRPCRLCNRPFRGKLGSKCGKMANDAQKMEKFGETQLFQDPDD